MNAKKADIFLVLASFMWGSGYIASDIGLKSGLQPFQLIAGRFVLAVILMACLFGRKLREISKKELRAGIILGLLTSLGFAFQMVGLVHTSVSNNAFLVSSNVVMVPFLFWGVAKVRPDVHSIIGVLMTVIGIPCLTMSNSLKISMGDAISLFSAFFYACNMVAAGRMLAGCSPVHITFIQFATAAVTMTVLMPFEGPHIMPSTTGMMTIAYLAIVATVMTYLIQNYAFKYTSPTKGSIILATESVFGTLLSVLLLHDTLTMRTLLGSAIIFSAIIFSEVKPKLPALHHPVLPRGFRVHIRKA